MWTFNRARHWVLHKYVAASSAKGLGHCPALSPALKKIMNGFLDPNPRTRLTLRGAMTKLDAALAPMEMKNILADRHIAPFTYDPTC